MLSIVYFGTPSFSAYILEQLILESQKSDSYIEIKTIVTQADQPIGRKQILTPSPVSDIGQKYGITTLKPARINQQWLEDNQTNLEADLYIVVAYGKILPQTLLDIPSKGAINVHYSLLPKYRGASPIQEAILHGDQQTGITIMYMSEQMDTGDIIKQASYILSPQDTFETVSTNLSHQSVPLLIDVLQQVDEDNVTATPQNEAKATYCREGHKSTLVDKEDGYFDIDNPPSLEQLNRMIRAYFPWPNAWTRWNGKVVKLYPGEMIQIEGKNPVPLTSFLNGYPDFPIRELK
jgi:methionyl-tRNA formyltransferase